MNQLYSLLIKSVPSFDPALSNQVSFEKFKASNIFSSVLEGFMSSFLASIYFNRNPQTVIYWHQLVISIDFFFIFLFISLLDCYLFWLIWQKNQVLDRFRVRLTIRELEVWNHAFLICFQIWSIKKRSYQINISKISKTYSLRKKIPFLFMWLCNRQRLVNAHISDFFTVISWCVILFLFTLFLFGVCFLQTQSNTISDKSARYVIWRVQTSEVEGL